MINPVDTSVTISPSGGKNTYDRVSYMGTSMRMLMNAAISMGILIIFLNSGVITAKNRRETGTMR